MKSTSKGGVSVRIRSGARRVAVAALLLCVIASGAAVAAEEPGRLDLNTASVAELESLPGVGPTKAQAIVAHREVAPFRSADELVEVKGIGEKLYAQLKDRVMVSGAPTAARKPGGDGGNAADPKTNRSAAAKP